MGYTRAGFDVEGVDHVWHADYPYEQWTGDVFRYLEDEGPFREFDVIHASPPCPRFSAATRDPEAHPDLLTPTREYLKAWATETGGIWVLENVVGAPLPDAVTLCGAALGLPEIRRHRLFASNAFILGNGCACSHAPPIGVYGNLDAHEQVRIRPTIGTSRGRKAGTVATAQRVLGIDWMTSFDDLTDAIPPNYTEFVGLQLIDRVTRP